MIEIELVGDAHGALVRLEAAYKYESSPPIEPILSRRVSDGRVESPPIGISNLDPAQVIANTT